MRQISPWVARLAFLCAVLGIVLPRGVQAESSACVGDCSEDGTITVDELVVGVRVALGTMPLSACASFDADSDLQVEIHELVAAIQAALYGCVLPVARTELTFTPFAARYGAGNSIAIKNDVLVLGSDGSGPSGPWPFTYPSGGKGAVYSSRSGRWQFDAEVVPDGSSDAPRFGQAVDTDGSTIGVGAPIEMTGRSFGGPTGGLRHVASGPGAVYLYQLSGSAWVQRRRLVHGAVGDLFGAAVALQGDLVLVGEPKGFTDEWPGTASSIGRGTAYLYDARTGVELDVLQPPRSLSAIDDYFGASVDIDGNLLVVGAPGAEAAYVFRRTAGTWSYDHRLFAPEAASGDRFGSRVAISGNTVVAAAPGCDETGIDAGMVHVFIDDGGSWRLQQRISVPASAGANLGEALALESDDLLIGAPGQSTVTGPTTGAAYLYRRVGSMWRLLETLAASDGAAGDRFGAAVALAADTAAIGAPGHSRAGSEAGALYLFVDSKAGPDGDGDQISDIADNCPASHNADQLDTDEDVVGDACDDDDDNDLLADVDEATAGTDPLDDDSDDDGVRDGTDIAPTDPDRDGDVILDGSDNCPDIANSNQLDTDIDRAGDACDEDDDGDDLTDAEETITGTDPLDDDTDDDSWDDAFDPLPTDPENGRAPDEVLTPGPISSVAASASNLVVGDRTANFSAGAATVFEHAGTWRAGPTLAAADSYQGQQFGYRIAAAAETVVVLDYDDLRFHLFERDAMGWAEIRTIQPWTEPTTGAAVLDKFDLDDGLFAYAGLENGELTINIDERRASGWVERAEFIGNGFDGIAIGQCTVFAADGSHNTLEGEVRVYEYSDGQWSARGPLPRPAAAVGFFGVRIAASGAWAFVADRATIFVFNRVDGQWIEAQQLPNDVDVPVANNIGLDLAAENTTVLTQRPMFPVGSGTAFDVYLFDGARWVRDHTFYRPNLIDPALATSGDRLFVADLAARQVLVYDLAPAADPGTDPLANCKAPAGS